ncbi:MAG TPA: hypothetical protein VNI01_15265 [Elusimicrobiota bacterium]|jgi:hypothetical protein|nr:hypothetical protein [Elusimicrobiota bacterium]
MPPVQIRAIAADGPKKRPTAGEIRVRIALDDGSETAVLASTPERPRLWVEEGGGFSFGKPALYLLDLSEASIQAGARALASDLGGYWLRYYNALGRGPAGKKPAKVVPVDTVHLATPEPASGAPARSAVVEVKLKDGRLFSLLAATPACFEQSLAASGLRFYFGPCPLFLRDIQLELARRAVEEMSSHGDRWLCAYDTPRRTLPDVLTEFRSRHA